MENEAILLLHVDTGFPKSFPTTGEHAGWDEQLNLVPVVCLIPWVLSHSHFSPPRNGFRETTTFLSEEKKL